MSGIEKWRREDLPDPEWAAMIPENCGAKLSAKRRSHWQRGWRWYRHPDNPEKVWVICEWCRRYTSYNPETKKADRAANRAERRRRIDAKNESILPKHLRSDA